MSQVWRISLSNLSRNLLEATELANVLQEVSSSIQVTGLSSSLSARTSTSTGGTPTKLSIRERIRNAVPIHIGAGAVPWEQLVGVVSSDDALQDPCSLGEEADRQPQVLEVNTGGTVFFLFFKLNRKQQQHYQQQQLQYQQQQQSASNGGCSSPSASAAAAGPWAAGEKLAGAAAAAAAAADGSAQRGGPLDVQGFTVGAASVALAPLGSMSQSLQQQQQQLAPPREGVAVLKVGFNRLAMQAEQFANELTRHLGIAAPDCRIVRQVGSTANEWAAALNAVNRLAGCRCAPPSTTPATCPGSTNSSLGGGASAATNNASSSSSSSQARSPGQPGGVSMGAAPGNTAAAAAAAVGSTGGALSGSASAAGSRCDSCGGCVPGTSLAGHAAAAAAAAAAAGLGSGGGGPAELLCELSHLPCFLLMEYVEGDRLSDSPQALQGCVVGRLLEDVGCLFLLDMLLGNADRMPCADLGWRGNANNLLYGAPGTRHEGRPVAIDSCVARRPPALKASAEDAAVERLAQLLLSVPDVSRCLLQQLLANVRRSRGKCSRLSLDGIDSTESGVWGSGQLSSQGGLQRVAGSTLGSCCSSAGGAVATVTAAAADGSTGGGGGHSAEAAAAAAAMAGMGLGGSRGGIICDNTCGAAAGRGGLSFSDGDIARFQAGLRKCLTGVLQIKGLLEMVSTKIAEWIAEFVADVVRLNPALLPSPAGGPPAPGGAPSASAAAAAGLLRSPRPSPRPSLRHLHLQAACSSGGGNTQQQQQQQQNAAGVPLPAPAFAAGVNASADSSDSSGSCMGNALPATGSSSSGSDHAAAAAAAVGVPFPAVCPNSGSTCSSRSNSGSCSPEPGPAASTTAATAGQGAPVPGTAAGVAVAAPGVAAPGAAEPAAVFSALRSPGRSESSRCSSAAGSDTPPPSGPTDGPAAAAAAAADPAAAAPDAALAAAAAAGPGSSHSHSQRGGLKFFKHLSSPAGKALARRAVSHLGFASIKAAICSTDPAAPSHPGSNSPSPTGGTASTSPLMPMAVSGCGSSSNSLAGTHADVATAVAAALSPRATHAQTQALAGVFGGGSFVGPDGAVLAKPGCARRVAWCSNDDSSQTPTKLSPRDFFPAASPADQHAPLCAADGRRAASCVIPAPVAAYSPQRSSNGSLGHMQQQQQQGGILARHASFPVHHAPPMAAAATAIAAAASPAQQQRSSSSSLQVLASIQLDATLASIKQEARHDGVLAERLAHWTSVFRERGAELSEAIASWQTRHHLAAVLSTGFLDGSHPIVDAYELGVRLQHMLRRLTALAAGAMVQAPICVLPGLFLGNAVAADSHHLLQYLGVTHVVNAAQELQVESAPGLFQVYRVAIRDEEEEDVSGHFQQVQAWIDAALSVGGAVLVHCHEGKSRSVALLLAYLMTSRGNTLAAALAHIRSVRPEACPNAGFMVQLIALDRQLHGSASLSRADLPRAKPEARICSICGAPAGLSYASLVRHMKTKHKAVGFAAAGGVSSGSRSTGGAAVVAVAGGKAATAAEVALLQIAAE